MKFTKTEIPGCYVIECFNQNDHRGGFVKAYNSELFKNNSFDFGIREVYYTWSKPGVFRGFHFQTPPHDHAKIVFCNVGAVTDYVVDLRKSSKVYGKPFEFELSENNTHAILIPKGCAHGFYVPERESMLTYMVETEYAPENDSGILWSSLGHNFRFDKPTISERDEQFITISKFKTPFE